MPERAAAAEPRGLGPTSDVLEIVDQLDIVAVSLDRFLRIRFSTEAACRLFGIEGRDVGRPLSEAMTDPDRTIIMDAVSCALGSQDMICRDVREIHGHLYEISVTPSRRRGADRLIVLLTAAAGRSSAVGTRDGDAAKAEGAPVSLARPVETGAGHQQTPALVHGGAPVLSGEDRPTHEDHAVVSAGEVVRSVPAPLVAVDEVGCLRAVNHAAADLFGRAPEELDGRQFEELLPDRLRKRFRSLSGEILAAANPAATAQDEGFAILDRTQEERAVELRLGRTQLENSRLLLVALCDISAYQNIQEKQRSAIASEQAQNASRLRLFSALGHDLRQPLQAASLLHDLLAREPLSPQAAVIMQRMGIVINGLSETATSLLDFGLLESGRITPTLSDFSVQRVLTYLSSEFNEVAGEKGLTLRMVPCSAFIRSDRQLLIRMLANLISNAIKYTKEGRILVGCRLSGDRLRIEVIDTGDGIEAHELDRIFDEHYRIQGRPSGGGSGLGLGLSVVRDLSGLLDHPVSVASASGRGSRFTVTVPLAEPRALPAAGGSFLQHPRSGGGRRHVILVVEADGAILGEIGSALDVEGFRVIPAGTASEALAQSETVLESLDLVFVDLGNERLDEALDLIRKIRDIRSDNIPAIVAEATGRDAVRSAIVMQNCIRLPKPFRMIEAATVALAALSADSS